MAIWPLSTGELILLYHFNCDRFFAFVSHHPQISFEDEDEVIYNLKHKCSISSKTNTILGLALKQSALSKTRRQCKCIKKLTHSKACFFWTARVEVITAASQVEFDISDESVSLWGFVLEVCKKIWPERSFQKSSVGAHLLGAIRLRRLRTSTIPPGNALWFRAITFCTPACHG